MSHLTGSLHGIAAARARSLFNGLCNLWPIALLWEEDVPVDVLHGIVVALSDC